MSTSWSDREGALHSDAYDGAGRVTVPPAQRAVPPVADDLQRRITLGEFRTGGLLPSEARLATEYQVSRSRIRTALASLARRGVLVSRPNWGWLVQADHQTQKLDRMRSFAEWAHDNGGSSGGQILDREIKAADAREARMLLIRLGEPVLRFTRLRSLNGQLVMIERSTWAPWVVPLVEQMPDDIVSTTAALADAGIHVAVANHRIEAVMASSAEARLLGVRRSSPLLQVGRTTETRDGRPVEIGVDRYLPDIVAFEIRAGDVVSRTDGSAGR